MVAAELQELEEVKNLVTKGQAEGVIAYGDVATALREVDVDEGDIEELYGFIESQGVELVDDVDPAQKQNADAQRTDGKRKRRKSPALDLKADMTTDSLQLFLDRHHIVKHRRIGGLAARGVGLAQHLLEEKAEAFSDRLSTAFGNGRTKGGDVRHEAVELLLHVHALGEDRDLLRDALFIDRDAFRELPNGGAESVAVLERALWGASCQAFKRVVDDLEPLEKEPAESAAFVRAHLREGGDRFTDDGEQFTGARLGDGIAGFARHDVGQAEDRGNVDRPEGVSSLKRAKLFDEMAEARFIDGDGGPVFVAFMAAVERDVAASDAEAERLAHIALEAAQ